MVGDRQACDSEPFHGGAVRVVAKPSIEHWSEMVKREAAKPTNPLTNVQSNSMRGFLFLCVLEWVK